MPRSDELGTCVPMTVRLWNLVPLISYCKHSLCEDTIEDICFSFDLNAKKGSYRNQDTKTSPDSLYTIQIYFHTK